VIWQLTTALLLGIGATLAVIRTVFGARGSRRAVEGHVGVRDWAAWLQVPSAVLLYFVLYPPAAALKADALTVVTPGATRDELRKAPHDQRVVSLTGAPTPPGSEVAPDLATALRAHPGVSHLTVIGTGLPARDRPAAAALSTVEFTAAPESGLTQVQFPASVPLGREWQLSGRAAAPVRRAELHDPAGVVVDAMDVDASGAFRLAGPARGVGPVKFTLRLLDEAHALVDTVSVPIVVAGGEPLRVIVRAGPINPELKYFRRWAEDTGLAVSFTAALTEGIAQNDGDARLDAGSLAAADVVIVDTRGWAALAANDKAALADAVEHGLGLLLRADAPLADETAADWAAMGFRLTPTATPRSVTLDRYLGLHDRTAFTMAPVDVDAPETGIAISSDDTAPLLWWRAQGAGRIGLSRLVDSYRLVLLGDSERYGNLWANTLEHLSRPHPAPPPGPRMLGAAWVFERVVLCGLGAAARVRAAADGPDVVLDVDAQGCAGYWPATAGWQTLESGGAAWPFYVRSADDGASWRASLDRQATLDLVTPPASAAVPNSSNHARGTPTSARGMSAAASAPSVPMSRWPWFYAWLALSAAIWWRERRGFRLAVRASAIS
jgi:hypothetical protein